MDIGSLVLEVLNGRSIEDVIAEALTPTQRANLSRRAKAMKVRSGLLRGKRDKTRSFTGRVGKKIHDYVRSGAKKLAHTAADAISNDPGLQKKLNKFARKANKAVKKEVHRQARETSKALGKASITSLAGAALGGTVGYLRHRHLTKKLGKPAKTPEERKLRRKQAAKRVAKGSLIGGGIGGVIGGAHMYRKYLKRIKAH